jgi:outer membrane lipoprotein
MNSNPNLRPMAVYRPLAALALLSFALTGCAPIPVSIVQPPPGDLQLTEAIGDIDAHQGTLVRWGGTILSVGREGETLWVEVAERQLDEVGQPVAAGPPRGRFLARLDTPQSGSGFVYGLDITVSGTVDGTREGDVGNRKATFPVVRVSTAYTWAPYVPYAYPAPYYRYGPYWRYGYRHRYRYY